MLVITDARRLVITKIPKSIVITPYGLMNSRKVCDNENAIFVLIIAIPIASAKAIMKIKLKFKPL